MRKSLREVVTYIRELASMNAKIEDCCEMTIQARQRINVADEKLQKLRRLRKAVETGFFSRLQRAGSHSAHDDFDWQRSLTEHPNTRQTKVDPPPWKPRTEGVEELSDDDNEEPILASPNSSPVVPGPSKLVQTKRKAFERLCEETTAKRRRF